MNDVNADNTSTNASGDVSSDLHPASTTNSRYNVDDISAAAVAVSFAIAAPGQGTDEGIDTISVPALPAIPVFASPTAAPAPPVIATPNAATRPTPIERRQRMKYAKQGIHTSKEFFIHPDKLGIYSHLADTIYLDGKITTVPRLQIVDYIFHWTPSTNLPIGFDETHLRTKVFKSHKSSVEMLKSARVAYDEKYPDQRPPGGARSNAPSRSPARRDRAAWSPR